MRIPTPAALLVEHPAVPVPGVDGGAVETQPVGQPVAAASLTRRERFSAALQLTAAASLLAEFDLWPGTAAVRDAVFVRTPGGLQASFGRFPLTMSRVYARLGGGERAAVTTRAAIVKAIARAVGLPVGSIDAGPGEPGFYLEGAIARQLRELKRPLDHATARALWAFRWDGLPVPDEGATDYWRVPIPGLGRRLGGALWASIRRRSGTAWLWGAGDDSAGTAPNPAIGGEGSLILVGEISSDELAAVSRWARRDGCSAAVIGSFPGGWHPPRPPGFDGSKLSRHLAVTGLALEDARRVVELKAGRIDPVDPTDRRALTEAGRRVFATVTASRGGGQMVPMANRLQHVLGLAREGLPRGFVALNSGLSSRALEDQRRALAIVETGERWRLVDCPPLEPDPLHLAVAGLYGEDDPRRLLHRALGDGDATVLEHWARSRLDALDAFSVRDLLSELASGALGHAVSLLLAEACLAIYDPSGARRVLASIPKARTDAHRRWLEAIDDRAGRRLALPGEDALEAHPRAVGEAALHVLNDQRRRGGRLEAAARDLIGRARHRVSDLLRRRFDIELAWIEDGASFADPKWRRRVIGDHPVLRAQFAHRRARQLMDDGRTRPARRLLELLADDRAGPGVFGMVELDLGAAALDDGRSREADAHQLRAHRLLQAAGFQHLTSRVLFNLAVGDLDQLEIRRAEERFAELAEDNPDDPYLSGEMARLYLAKGELARFRRQTGAFVAQVDEHDPRFAEAVKHLRGVEALLDGDLVKAGGLLRGAGQEGEAWAGLAGTVAGREADTWQPDGWGVARAAEIVHEMVSGKGDVTALIASGKMTRSQALSVALAEHVLRTRLPIDGSTRVEALRALRDATMDGWAETASGGAPHDEGVVEVLAEIVEGAGLEGLSPDLGNRLVVALGLSGLEVRATVDGRVLWRLGDGSAGAEVRHRRIAVVPLGGEAHEGATWRLLMGVLELFAPAPAVNGDTDVEETGFHGVSTAAQGVRRELRALAPTHLPVILVGETGVGKEVAARALHRLSGRRGAFVPVNVAAIPSSLLEAELFGSVKGAFTGADRSRQGLAVAADGGTLFLDEVGDLDPPLQVKLLRFLEDQEVRAVGATRSRKVDVRIVSATHRDLEGRVREGGFRQDLYYRVAAAPLAIPPLRDRREDIALLRDHFERNAASRHGLPTPVWSGEAEAMIRRYPWPGNVRELRQAVEVAMVRAAGSIVRPEHLPVSEPTDAPTGTWDEAQRDFRRNFLRAALKRNNGNRSATARELGISRQTLLYHMRNLGLGGRADR